MPIVSHTWAGTVQVDGTTSFVLRMFTQDGEERQKIGLLPVGVEVQGFVDLKIAETNQQLADEEAAAIIAGG